MGGEVGGFCPQLARISGRQSSTGGETNFIGQSCGSALKFSTNCSTRFVRLSHFAKCDSGIECERPQLFNALFGPPLYAESAGSPFPALSGRPPTPSWLPREVAFNFQPALDHESRDERRRPRTGVLLTRSTFHSPCVANSRALRRYVEFRRACWRAGVQGA